MCERHSEVTLYWIMKNCFFRYYYLAQYNRCYNNLYGHITMYKQVIEGGKAR